ncbi:hypothetical protein ACQR75_15265, partial [Klebsiella pneumoniae]
LAVNNGLLYRANGTMTGYAGGVQRKEWLLRHEGYLLL